MGDGLGSQRPDLASSADVVEGLHEKTILEAAVRSEDLLTKSCTLRQRRADKPGKIIQAPNAIYFLTTARENFLDLLMCSRFQLAH